MLTSSWFGLIILFLTSIFISAISALIIYIIFSVSKKKSDFNINLKKFYIHIWIIITESAICFFIFNPLWAFLIWSCIVLITTSLFLKNLKNNYIMKKITEKRYSCRIELEKEQIIIKENFFSYCKLNYLKTIFFSFGIFFISFAFSLIPFLEVEISYSYLVTYLYYLLLMFSFSIIFCFVVYILKKYVGWWPSRVDWYEDKGYRIIWYCFYIGVTLFSLIILTIAYFSGNLK